jgi:uncharacterized membrane protein
MSTRRSPRTQFIGTLGLSSLVSIALFAYGAWRENAGQSGYLIWNLFLAWLPLVFALRLTTVLRGKLWSSWEALGLSLLWLSFLPNSFYMISDYIHLQDLPASTVLYDAVMFTSFIFNGVLIGFTSLFLIHLQLRKRFRSVGAAFWICLTLLLCSIAIYLGRDLRWNSWDILTNPGGLMFDVSDRLLHPSEYPQMLLTIGSFLVLLFSMYALVWRAARLLLRTGAARGR